MYLSIFPSLYASHQSSFIHFKVALINYISQMPQYAYRMYLICIFCLFTFTCSFVSYGNWNELLRTGWLKRTYLFSYSFRRQKCEISFTGLKVAGLVPSGGSRGHSVSKPFLASKWLYPLAGSRVLTLLQPLSSIVTSLL